MHIFNTDIIFQERRQIRNIILFAQQPKFLDSGASYYDHERTKRSLYDFEENDIEGSGSSGEIDFTELPVTDDSFEDQEEDFSPRSQDFG